MNMFKPIKAKTVKEYLASVPKEVEKYGFQIIQFEPKEK